MRKLELVKQVDYQGCTIACLSMIVGVPYFPLREILHLKVQRLKNAIAFKRIGLYPDEFNKILFDQFNISSRFIRFVSLRDLKKHCVLFMRPIVFDATEHAVVYDAVARCILDPTGGSIDINNYNVCTCIMIL